MKKEYNHLPEQLRAYVERIEGIAEVPIYLISLGLGRESTVSLKNIFSDE